MIYLRFNMFNPHFTKQVRLHFDDWIDFYLIGWMLPRDHLSAWLSGVCVMCHVSCVIFSKFFGWRGGASWWRICYQHSLPHVFIKKIFKKIVFDQKTRKPLSSSLFLSDQDFNNDIRIDSYFQLMLNYLKLVESMEVFFWNPYYCICFLLFRTIKCL